MTIRAQAKSKLQSKQGPLTFFKLSTLESSGLCKLAQLPYSIRILLENAVRNCDGKLITEKGIQKLAHWHQEVSRGHEIAFKPGRVVLQDFTGVPAVVDLAAMRSALKRLGGDYRKINPQVPCDLVIDHSVQVDAFGSKEALAINSRKEFERNRERYEFLKWGQNAFQNFRVVPPATGIVHQVNLEYLAQGVLTSKVDGEMVAYPDTLVGTDSHTTMINGLGVIGWGVGGIEAEAVMLGEPIFMLMPEVIGCKLSGKLREGVTATDLVLTATQSLRQLGVVGKFVEYFGSGYASLSLPDRATLANMAPEYGATVGFCPTDQETLRYYRLTARAEAQVDLVERYLKEQQLFLEEGGPDPTYTKVLEIDLNQVEPCLAGPKRPQDRIALSGMKQSFRSALTQPKSERGFGLASAESKAVAFQNDSSAKISHGSTVIAAITSCTNTSNPAVLIGAGLLAQKAVERGLQVKPYVKTSLAPGSTVVTEYLRQSGLDKSLEALGFHTVGYGCTTCIGNSGPLPDAVREAIQSRDLVAASVLSGNRNFEGRVNPLVKANYLASPPLVVAFALAGRVDIDLETEALGQDKQGNDVFLKDIWPKQSEVQAVIQKSLTKQMFQSRYKDVFKGSQGWVDIPAVKSDLYKWNKKSTYVQEPPFFETMTLTPEPVQPIKGARVLVLLGDSVTTDHISPAGAIAATSPAGVYLASEQVKPSEFNSYGSRRGNDRVMLRGTFANIRLRNQLTPGKEGSSTLYFGNNTPMSIFDAAVKYRQDQTPLMVLAGKEYGSGSSRDWAAKGTALLGVRAVIAESYERIHRSNLVGMGVLPLQFKAGDSVKTLGLDGSETFDIEGVEKGLSAAQDIKVRAYKKGGKAVSFVAKVRIDTPIEVEYYAHGGILKRVIRKLA